MKPLIELRDITLVYGNVYALNRVNLEIYPAEVHALIGEHSAGKTSIAHILSGLVKPLSGRILCDDRFFSALSTKQAGKAGIRIVTQKNSLFPGLTVSENFFLKHNKFELPLFSGRRKTAQKVKQYLDRHQISLSPASLVKNINIPERFFLDIIINLYHLPKLLILDEALENINKSDLERIIPILKSHQQQGMAILLITHQVENIYEFAHKVTILRNGKVVLTDAVDSIDQINLIQIAYTQMSKNPHVTPTNIAFRQLLKYTEAILEHLPINLLVVDNDNNVQLINHAAKQYFNVTSPIAGRMPVESLFKPENYEVRRLICDTLRTDSEETFMSVPLTVQDATHKTDIIIYPIHEGVFKIGSIVMLNDITERETLREQITLSENLASLGLLAAGVAHEINNPLEIIYSCLDHVKLNLKNKTLEPTVDDITEEINAIAQIVSSLLTFSDKYSKANEIIDLNELLESIVKLVKFSAQRGQIQINFSPSEKPVCIRANKTEIKQVILNMIKNGFEAMPSGGKFQIETRQDKQKGSDIAVMVFCDTGGGIKETAIKNLFSPFYSTKGGVQGHLGLGLSVSYGIITKYDGTISVHNQKPTGAEFTIAFPMVAESELRIN
jgi:PAS domain S-box-containing protein